MKVYVYLSIYLQVSIYLISFVYSVFSLIPFGMSVLLFLLFPFVWNKYICWGSYKFKKVCCSWTNRRELEKMLKAQKCVCFPKGTWGLSAKVNMFLNSALKWKKPDTALKSVFLEIRFPTYTHFRESAAICLYCSLKLLQIDFFSIYSYCIPIN